MPLLVILLAGGTVFLAGTLVFSGRRWKGLLRHQDMSKEFFLHYFARRDVSNEVAAAVYDYYGNGSRRRTFGVSPSDDIEMLFQQEGDDTAEDFVRILLGLGLEMPHGSAWDLRKDQPIKTIEDLVFTVAWAAQNQPLKANKHMSEVDGSGV